MQKLRSQFQNLKQKKWLQTFLLLGGAIAIILSFGFTQFDAPTLWSQIQQFSYEVIALSLGAVLVQIFCQTARLWFLFPKSIHLSWKRAAIAFIRGQFVGNWVSTQAGYAVKIWYLRPKTEREHQRLPLLSATAIIFLDKIVDIAVLILLSFGGAIWFLQTNTHTSSQSFLTVTQLLLGLGQLIRSHAITIAAIFVGLTACVYFLKKHFRDQLQSWTQFQILKQQLQTSLSFLRAPSQVLGASAMGFGDWVFEMLSLQILCVAQNLHLNFAQLTLCLLILNLGISVPSGIANVGAFEASLTFALMQFGLPLEQSLVIAVIYHLLQLLGITLWYLLISVWKNQSQINQSQTDSQTKAKHL